MKRIDRLYKLVALALFAMLLGFSHHARADCPATGLPAVYSYGSVAVSNTVAVGDAIPGTTRPFHLVGKCAGSSTFSKPVVICPNSSAVAVAGMTGVYATNVAGIGMRVRDANGKPMVGTGNCSTDSSLGNTGADGSFDVSGTFELVKTGAPGSGSLSGASYYTGVLNTGYQLNEGSNTVSVANNTPVRAVTCSVTAATANQTIPLATVSPSMFPAAGAVAARTPFTLGLSCEAGVKASVTFSSTSGTSGVASVLANAGTAKGVGVQLLDPEQAPLVLDSPVLLTANTTGDMSFPFYAQYYRMDASPVVAGTVHVTAVFTVCYQ